jgi:hypothetical protein
VIRAETARQLSGNTPLQQYDNTVFSMESDSRLYNESVFSAKNLDQTGD